MELKEKEQQYDVILSFTTWKKRIYDRKLLYVIHKALTQKTEYRYKLVMVLSSDEFKNGNADVPKEILELEKLANGKFEILWTKENTRALKKLDPSMEKWPELPIIVFDDDELLAPKALQTFMDEHKKTPNTIIGCDCHPLTRKGVRYEKIKLVTHVRLFPPYSLEKLNNKIFFSIFQGLEDDIYNGVRAAIKGTQSRRIGIVGITLDGRWFPRLYSQQTAFSNEYCHHDAISMVLNFVDRYPEYKKYVI